MVLPLSVSAGLILVVAGSGRGEEPSGKVPPPDSNPFDGVQSEENLVRSSRKFATSANHRFQFQKGGQLFIRTDDETLPIPGVRVSNEDRSPVAIHG